MTSQEPLDRRIAAVTGASGFLGDALVSRLVLRRPVRGLYRTPSDRSAALGSRGCEVVLGDLDNDHALAALVAGADEVYHCAATMAKGDAALCRHVNVEGTGRVARAALAAGVRRFVYVSSASIYAASRRDDNTYPESFEPQHVERLNPCSRTKYEAERLIQRMAVSEGLRFTVIRPTNVYGLRSRPWFRQWETLLRRLPLAFGDIPIDIVYVKDVVMALECAAASGAAENEVFNIGHEMVKMRHFLDAVGCVIGRETTRLPPSIDRGLCAAIDRGFSTITHTMLAPSLVRPAVYPHAKARAAFGYFPQYRLLDGMAEMKRQYRPAA